MPRNSRSRLAKTIKKVYIYIRVSKAREKMISPELQLEQCMRLVRQDNLTVVEVIYDLDQSGRQFAKRKVEWIIRQIEDGHADGVIVWEVSRWGRNLEASLRHVRMLQDAGGDLKSATEPLGEIETPFGKFNLNLLLSMAELKSDQLGESWMNVQEHRRKAGLPNNGKPRFGYVYDPDTKRYSQDPITAPWLREAYITYVSGKPISRVVTKMREAGIVGTGGKPFTLTALLFVLDSGFGAGLIIVNARRGRAKEKQGPTEYLVGRHGSEHREGTEQNVISPDEWLLYKARRAESHAPRHVNPVSPLASLIVCGSCGRRMFRAKDGDAFQWVCRNKGVNTNYPCPRQATIRGFKVTEAVVEWLQEKADPTSLPTALQRDEKRERLESDLRLDQDRDKVLERRLLNWATMRADGELSAEEHKKLRAEAEAERAAIAARAAKSRIAPAPVAPAPDALLACVQLLTDEDVDPADANPALKVIIKKVTVWPRGGEKRIEVTGVWEVSEDQSEGEAA